MSVGATIDCSRRIMRGFPGIAIVNGIAIAVVVLTGFASVIFTGLHFSKYGFSDATLRAVRRAQRLSGQRSGGLMYDLQEISADSLFQGDKIGSRPLKSLPSGSPEYNREIESSLVISDFAAGPVNVANVLRCFMPQHFVNPYSVVAGVRYRTLPVETGDVLVFENLQMEANIDGSLEMTQRKSCSPVLGLWPFGETFQDVREGLIPTSVCLLHLIVHVTNSGVTLKAVVFVDEEKTGGRPSSKGEIAHCAVSCIMRDILAASAGNCPKQEAGQWHVPEKSQLPHEKETASKGKDNGSL